MHSSEFEGFKIFNWAFQASNANAVTGWGFWFGTIGLFVSVVGFALTLLQVSQAKRAAVAAAEASERARKRVAGYDVIAELSQAASSLSTTRENIKREDWSAVVESYAEARISLTKVAELSSELTPESKLRLSNVAEQIERVARRIAVALGKGEGTLDRMKLLHSHADYEVAVTAVTARVDRTK